MVWLWNLGFLWIRSFLFNVYAFEIQIWIIVTTKSSLPKPIKAFFISWIPKKLRYILINFERICHYLANLNNFTCTKNYRPCGDWHDLSKNAQKRAFDWVIILFNLHDNKIEKKHQGEVERSKTSRHLGRAVLGIWGISGVVGHRRLRSQWVKDLSLKVHTTIQPVFVSWKIERDLNVKETKPPIVNQQCVVFRSTQEMQKQIWLFCVQNAFFFNFKLFLHNICWELSSIIKQVKLNIQLQAETGFLTTGLWKLTFFTKPVLWILNGEKQTNLSGNKYTLIISHSLFNWKTQIMFEIKFLVFYSRFITKPSLIWISPFWSAAWKRL